MRTILVCNKPETPEETIKILFQASYAYSSPAGGIFSAYGKPPNKPQYQYHSSTQNSSHNRQTQRQTGNNRQNFSQGRTDRNIYNQHNGHYSPHIAQRSNNQNNYNQHDGQSNWNPFKRQYRTNPHRDNHLSTPEPMDTTETSNNRHQNIGKKKIFDPQPQVTTIYKN